VFKFPQQHILNNNNKNKIRKLSPLLTNHEINLELNSLSSCCPAGGKSGCILNHFTDIKSGDINFNTAIEFYAACRNLTRLKSIEELDSFIQEEFRKCISETKTLENGKKLFVMIINCKEL